MLKKLFLIFFGVLFFQISFSQDKSIINKLLKDVETLSDDTSKVKALNSISYQYRENNNILAVSYGETALALAKKLNYNEGLWYANNNLGEAKRYLGKSAEAIEYHQAALNIAEKNNFKILIGHSYNNLAIILKNNKNFKQAEEYFLLSLKAYQEINDLDGYYSSANNIGNLYSDQEKYDIAYSYYLKGYQTAIQLKDSAAVSQVLCNLADLLFYTDKKDSSTFLYAKAYKIALRHSSKKDIVHIGANLAYMYFEYTKFEESEALFKKMFVVARTLKDENEIADLYEYSSLLYSRWKKYDLAYLYKDSSFLAYKRILNSKNSESINNLTAVYENEKKELQIKNLSAENEVKNEKIKRENTFKIVFAIGFIILGIFAVYLFYSLKEKERSRKIIDVQKNALEEKQKEILDSIHYAKRIQQALLPNEKYIMRSISKLKDKKNEA